MDYRYKDTVAVPREYAITTNWLHKIIKDQSIFVLTQEQEFLMSTPDIPDSLSCWHENTPALYEQCSHRKSEMQNPIRYVTIHS